VIVLLLNAPVLVVVRNDFIEIVAVTVSVLEVPISAAGTVPVNVPVLTVAVEPVNPTVNVPANVPLFAQVPPEIVMLADRVVVVAVREVGVTIWNPKVDPTVALAVLVAPVVTVRAENDEKLPSAYMEVPANEAAVIWFEPVVNPNAEIKTEVPAGPDEGVRVTVGAVIVNVAASGAATGSEICTE